MFVWAPSWCSPFCPEALQPTRVGIHNFGAVGKRLRRRILAEVPIHLIQVHGDEDDAFCRQFDRPYIKAIRVQTASDIQNAAHRFPNAQALLFDAYHPSEYGGTGHCFDWTLLAEYSGKPWVLAGGLTPENVGEAVRITGAESVDVSGGVEASKGKKDAAKVAAFIREANRVSA